MSQTRTWHLLLHYEPRWFGGVKSEVDGSAFFLSPEGKYEPEAELGATLRALVEPVEGEAPNEHAQCRFPARAAWLREVLEVPRRAWPVADCPFFSQWKERINADRVTLIFASFFVNNPASMFGHTMLRFDQPESAKRSRLLDYSVNYAANSGEDAGLFYAIWGLTGVYPGTFSLYPYYYKVQEYSNFESRDIWEYPLRLTPKQVDRLIEHLWEVGHTYFDYYFVDENCSYHLLSLLEVANPKTNYRSALHFFVTPSDTIKAIVRDLDGEPTVTYRPSKLTRVQNYLDRLRGEEKRMLRTMVGRKLSLSDARLQALSPTRRLLLADTAIELLSYREKLPTRTEYQRKLLRERSQLSSSAPAVSDERPRSTPPHVGHDSIRIGVGGGITQNDSYEEIRFRGAYHDLLADDNGYPSNSTVEGMRLRLRVFNQERKFHVEDVTLINIISLVPHDEFVRKPSWNVSFGYETLRNEICGRCNAFYVRGGPGLTVASRIGRREVIYVLLNGQVQVSPWSDVEVRLGPEGRLGLLVDLAQWWKLQFEGKWDYSPLGHPDTLYAGTFGQRFSLSTNMELRTEASLSKSHREAGATFLVYF